MTRRRHHNNTGRRTCQSGKTARQMRALALRLGIPFMSAREIQRERIQIIHDHAEGMKRVFEQAITELQATTGEKDASQ